MKRAALYMTLLSSVGYSFVPTLSRRRSRVKASITVMSSLPDDCLPAKMGALADALRSAPSDLARAQALVQLGDRWSQETGSVAAVENGVRVPGCTAAVTVAVALEPSLLNSSELNVRRVFGTADARLSQGLLALVAQGLEGCTASEALAFDTAALSTRAGLLTALTPSRSNGLASLVATLQGLIRAQQQTQLNAASVTAAPAQVAGAAAAVTGSLAQNVWSGAAPGTLAAAGSSASSEEVAVLLSGGVDSSVALRLVMEQGFKPRCFYLKIWLEDELAHLNK